jgi:type IV pilus assembly protein PilC
MAKFKIKAINQKGERYKGIRESSDKFALYAELKAEGDTLVSAAEMQGNGFSFLPNLSFFRHVPEHQKIIFTKNLGEMIDAGLPLVKSLFVINRQMGNAYFKNVISEMSDDIRQGKTLSEAAGNHRDIFSNLFISMTKAGEESGNLSGALKIIGSQMEASYNLKRKIEGAMIYPIIILLLAAAIGVAMLVYVVPSITATFSGLNIQLPASTKFLIDSSNFLKNNLILFLLACILLVAGFSFFRKSKQGRHILDILVLKVPVVGELVRETNLARLSRTVSSLLSSGVPFSEALLITEDIVDNTNFKELVSEAKDKIEKGKTISSVFLGHENMSPIFVGEMMAVGEETGRLPAMLMEVANYYENSIEQKTKDMSTIIEPFLMIAIGVAVGFFAFSIIKPIYSLTESIQ